MPYSGTMPLPEDLLRRGRVPQGCASDINPVFIDHGHERSGRTGAILGAACPTQPHPVPTGAPSAQHQSQLGRRSGLPPAAARRGEELAALVDAKDVPALKQALEEHGQDIWRRMPPDRATTAGGRRGRRRGGR